MSRDGGGSQAGRRARITRVRDGGGRARVVTWEKDREEGKAADHKDSPCARCPWRRDAPLGAFPAEVYRASAPTAYDQATAQFGCHASPPGEPQTCAGFLLRGAAHNITVRRELGRHGADYANVHSKVELYDSYREMAVANGVNPNDPVLGPCRDDAAMDFSERHEDAQDREGEDSIA